jgi:membrane fusion protein, multidrug efflux system
MRCRRSVRHAGCNDRIIEDLTHEFYFVTADGGNQGRAGWSTTAGATGGPGMIGRILLALGVVLLVAAGLYYARPFGTSEPAQAARPEGGAARALPVLAAEVMTRSMPVEISTIGNVQPIASVAVKPRIDGQIVKVAVKDGQDVKTGDVLFLLDSRQAQAALEQALATLQRDHAQLDNARRELARLTPLGKKDFASKQQLDTAQTGVDAAEATVKADQAAVENAQVQLSYTTIRAPIDGRLGTIAFKLGNIVRTGDSSPLVTLNQLHPIYVAFSVAERYLAELQRAMAAGPLPVTATIPGRQGAAAQGQVSYLENMIDSESGTLSVKATFANQDETLWPGQFVNVVVQLRLEPDALVVPSQAVQQGQSGGYVYVIKPDDTVELRPVTIDRTIGGDTVIASGVAAGERVVTDGQMRLIPGARVEVQKPAAAGQPERTS